MKVYKFGGASIADPTSMSALLAIVAERYEQPTIYVVSALGKTTNALEAIANHAFDGRKQEALELAGKLENVHTAYATSLLTKKYLERALEMVRETMGTVFDNINTGPAGAPYNEFYDRLVCCGELMSSLFFSMFMAQACLKNEWADVRTIIKTDSTFRDAGVDWATTTELAQQHFAPLLADGKSIVVQGFIGSTPDGRPITLGREGSDYTAAVLAAALQAESVTIWKDVDGFRNADPKQFADTVKIDRLPYNEVIEMAYYGAQIIHPKTIKPLQNNNIPLFVKCFLDKDLPGSEISDAAGDAFPPMIVKKGNQVLLQVTTRDFSFITEDNLSRIYACFHELHIKVNLIQNAAISFVACIDDRPELTQALTARLSGDYKILSNSGVTLLTVRHHTPETVQQLTAGRQVILKQETRKTVQVVMA
jgi:aspartate kinase